MVSKQYGEKHAYAIDMEDLSKCKTFLNRFNALCFSTWMDDVELMNLLGNKFNRIEYVKSKLCLEDSIKFHKFMERCKETKELIAA
jgi:hypothetical protein